jgi:hypothetical protein
MDIEKITDVMHRSMQDSFERETLSALTDGCPSSSDGNHTISTDEMYQGIMDARDRLSKYDIARTLKVHTNPYLTDKVRTFTPRSKKRRIQKKSWTLYGKDVPSSKIYLLNIPRQVAVLDGGRYHVLTCHPIMEQTLRQSLDVYIKTVLV